MIVEPIIVDEQFAELIPGYLANVLIDYESLNIYFIKKDPAGMGKICHKILGTAASYGFIQLDGMIKNLQSRLEVTDWSLIKEDMALIQSYFNHIKCEFNHLEFKKELSCTGQEIKTIFLIDDQDDIHLLARAIFRKYPQFKVIHYTSAMLALADIESKGPNLIISDLNMPMMGGLEFLSELLKMPPIDRPPLIMLTAEVNLNEIQKLKVLGASEVFDKSLGINNLISRLPEILDNLK